VALQRLQGLLTAISPALERALDLRRKSPLIVLGFWQTPAAIRAAGAYRIETLLRQSNVRNAAAVTESLLDAANCQLTQTPGQASTAAIVAKLATDVLTLNGGSTL
jgi:hypothetical protein